MEGATAIAVTDSIPGDYDIHPDTDTGCSTGTPTSVSVESKEGKAIELQERCGSARRESIAESFYDRRGR